MPKMQTILARHYVDNRNAVESLVDALRSTGWITYTQAPILRDAIANRLPGELTLEARTPKSVIYITLNKERLRLNNRAKLLTGLYTDDD